MQNYTCWITNREGEKYLICRLGDITLVSYMYNNYVYLPTIYINNRDIIQVLKVGEVLENSPVPYSEFVNQYLPKFFKLSSELRALENMLLMDLKALKTKEQEEMRKITIDGMPLSEIYNILKKNVYSFEYYTLEYLSESNRRKK